MEKENPQGPDELRRAYYQLYIKDYLRCVASVDDSVGALLDFLDQSGQTDNTIVVYASDQGFYLGEHGWFDKRFMYEQSLRTPLVMRWPGVTKPGSVEDRIVSNVDFAATFLEAAGATVPDDMQGRSLLPILRGENPGDWRKILLLPLLRRRRTRSPRLQTRRRHQRQSQAHSLLSHWRVGDV